MLGRGVAEVGPGRGARGAHTGGDTRSRPRQSSAPSLSSSLPGAGSQSPPTRLRPSRRGRRQLGPRCLAPRTPRPSQSLALPSGGPGGSGLVPRGPRQFCLPSLEPRCPARNCTEERGRGKAGPGAVLRGSAAPRSLTTPKLRAAAEQPGPPPALPPSLGLGLTGRAGCVAQTDPGRCSGPRARRAPGVGGRPERGPGELGARVGLRPGPLCQGPPLARPLISGPEYFAGIGLFPRGLGIPARYADSEAPKVWFGGPPRLHSWSQLPGLYLKAFRSENGIKRPLARWRPITPVESRARPPSALPGPRALLVVVGTQAVTALPPCGVQAGEWDAENFIVSSNPLQSGKRAPDVRFFNP